MKERAEQPAGSDGRDRTVLTRRGFVAGSARRAAALGLGAGAAGLALWPVTPRSRRAVPRGRTVIRYWEKWTGVEGLAVQAMVDRFNEEQSRIYVERLAVSDENSKAMIAVAGGDPPDVMGLFSYSVPQYALAGAAMPFDELGIEFPEGYYVPAIKRALSFPVAGRERQFAGANTCYTLALYANSDHFAAEGVATPTDRTTIEELFAAAVAMTKRDDTERITRAGFHPLLPWWWYYLWPVSFAGAGDVALFDETANRATIGEDHAVRAYEWLQAFPKRLGRGDLNAFSSSFAKSFHNTEDPFLSGRLSMALQGPWLANFANQYAPNLKYSVVPMPAAAAAKRGVGLVECDVLMIPRGCKHPEEAAEFVKFTQRRDVQESLCSAHAKPSPLEVKSPEFFAKHPNPYAAVFNEIVASPEAFILPRTRQWKQYALLLYPAFQKIWEGADVRRELTAVQTRTQELLDKDAAMRAVRGALGGGA